MKQTFENATLTMAGVKIGEVEEMTVTDGYENRITRLKKLLKFESSRYPLGTVITARQENARLKPLLDAMVECVVELEGHLDNPWCEMHAGVADKLNKIDEAIEAAGKE